MISIGTYLYSFTARTRRGSKHEKLEDITEQKQKEDNSEQVNKSWYCCTTTICYPTITICFPNPQSAEKSSDLLNGNAGPAAGWQPHPLPEEKGQCWHIKKYNYTYIF